MFSDNEERNVTIKKEIETVVEAVKLCENETIKGTECTSEITRSFEKTEKIKITEVRTIKRSGSNEMLNNVDNASEMDLTNLKLGIPVEVPKLHSDSLLSTDCDNDKLFAAPEKDKPIKLLLEEQNILPPKPPPR